MNVKQSQAGNKRILPSCALRFLTDVYPASIEALHGNAEALPFGSQPVADGNHAVLKDHSPSWLGVPAHLGKSRVPSACPRSGTAPAPSTELLSASPCQAAAEHPRLCGLASVWKQE